MTRTQLRELAEPFPPALVKKPPQGKYGSYVNHATYTERLLSIVHNFDFEVLEPIRSGDTNQVVGCLARLTATIDGEKHTVVEVGTEDHPNNGHDAKNLKNAASDAFKRCAMRLGLGLHLWSQSDYFLDKQLDKEAAARPPSALQSLGMSVKDAAAANTVVIDASAVTDYIASEFGGVVAAEDPPSSPAASGGDPPLPEHRGGLLGGPAGACPLCGLGLRHASTGSEHIVNGSPICPEGVNDTPAGDPDVPPETCPKCGKGGVYDNRAENVRRLLSGENPMPVFACRERDDCGWIKWADEWHSE